MSQIKTRKGPVGEEKDKRQSNSPVKDMKKKLAANAEKEKQAAEKHPEKPAPQEKPAENADKTDKKDKDKHIDKNVDKKEKDKSTEKEDKVAEKTPDKKDKPDKKEKGDKKESQPELAKEESSKEKNAKAESSEEKKKDEKVKQNGAKVTNGEAHGDTVSSEDERDEDFDEMFPELAYDDSDGEGDARDGPSRSYTRRSQVKATRTPETPRPASDKLPEKDDESKEKVLKLKDDPRTDRKLRSSDSPMPQDKKEKDSKKSDSPKKPEASIPEEKVEDQKAADAKEKVEDTKKVEIAKKLEVSKEVVEDAKDKEDSEKLVEIEVIVEVENEESRSKADTNYSKSRVKVSPYRRSMRLADQTNCSVLANYTGNNSTMEMDISESSLAPEEVASPYLSGLRSIRGRRSYKPLKEMALRHIGADRSTRSAASLNISDQPLRPTGTVVGRKRKPDDVAEGAGADAEAGGETGAGKRARLLQRLARPFRSLAPRHGEIVGINTDLPLTAPAVSADAFDPEVIKPDDDLELAPARPLPVIPTPTPTPTLDRDSKRCIVM